MNACCITWKAPRFDAPTSADVNHVCELPTDHYEPRCRCSCGAERPITTKTGKVLTDADLDALAAEAERGYDVSKLRDRR